MGVGVDLLSALPETHPLHPRIRWRMQWNRYAGIMFGKYSLAVEIDVPQPNLI